VACCNRPVPDATYPTDHDRPILSSLLLSSLLLSDDGMEMDEAGEEDAAVPQKRPKVPERCRFWPVCKSGDECPYHHPTTQCK